MQESISIIALNLAILDDFVQILTPISYLSIQYFLLNWSVVNSDFSIKKSGRLFTVAQPRPAHRQIMRSSFRFQNFPNLKHFQIFSQRNGVVTYGSYTVF